MEFFFFFFEIEKENIKLYLTNTYSLRLKLHTSFSWQNKQIITIHTQQNDISLFTMDL